ncbi:hypothetical protein EX30DRAFT_364660 [Ascodesmis nigricans]|uniref:Hydrophobin n=1 Tax=Ascodesmis nigricans TaxID=341454 RepID=A0A4S2MU90_9PEZI|nr:hypothetical protein EX30DRAFT_364660 [Ascodesmis nigricans]
MQYLPLLFTVLAAGVLSTSTTSHKTCRSGFNQYCCEGYIDPEQVPDQIIAAIVGVHIETPQAPAGMGLQCVEFDQTCEHETVCCVGPLEKGVGAGCYQMKGK